MRGSAVAIVAMADNGVIGRGNGLPWHLPDDLKRFKALTMGHVMLMGRKTWDTIGRALPGRQSIVLTRNPVWQAPGAERAASLDEAIARAGDSTLFVIGGAEVVSIAGPATGRVELTEVHAEPQGDTWLEGFDRADWRETFRERHAADARHAHPFSFVTLVRR